jgi:DNA-binding NtrC family response regulator
MKLAEILTALQEWWSLDVPIYDVMNRISRFGIKVLKARRCLVVQLEDKDGSFRSVVGRNLDNEALDSIQHLSRTVLNQALDIREPLIIPNVRERSDLNTSSSLSRLEVGTLIVVPLQVRGQPWGLLYFDRRYDEEPFTQDYEQITLLYARLAEQVIQAHEQYNTPHHRRSSRLRGTLHRFGKIEIIGKNAQFQKILELVHQAAPLGTSILLLGEDGVGKHHLAQAIHELSSRASGPFVYLNSETLTENSDLFELRTAGAEEKKSSVFHEAAGGTLFLDDIHKLSAIHQVRLNYFIESGLPSRLRDANGESPDVRIVAAASQNLIHLRDNGSFRNELYYRLAAVELSLPPLRERPEDIILLSRHFLKEAGNGDAGIRLAPETFEFLQRYTWPGNITELRRVIEGLLVAGRRHDTNIITPEHLPKYINPEGVDGIAPPKIYTYKQQQERIKYVNALRENKGIKRRVANLIGVSRTTVYNKIAYYSIFPEEYI